MVNEDSNAKLIRELKEEISRLRDLLKAEGIQVEEGKKCWEGSYLTLIKSGSLIISGYGYSF